MNKQDWQVLCGIIVGFIIFLCIAFVFNTLDNLDRKTLPREPEIATVYDTPASRTDQIEYFYTEQGWYKGCAEFACAAMLLSAYNYPTSIPMLLEFTEFSDTDFVYCYRGNVNDSGTIFSEGLVYAVNSFLDSIEGHDIQAYALVESQWSVVEKNVRNGIPVACWVTSDMELPTFIDGIVYDRYSLYDNENCVVVTDVDNESNVVTYLDPNENKQEVTMDLEKFIQVWSSCGGVAMKIDSATV